MPIDYGAHTAAEAPIDYGAHAPEPPPKTSLLDDVGDTLHQYWSQVNPQTQAEGIVAPVVHPKDTYRGYVQQQQDLLNRSGESFKKGEYSEGVRHGLMYALNGIPGVGEALDRAGNKAGAGDYKGAVADTMALATFLLEGKLGGKLTEAMTEPGVVSRPANALKQGAKAAAPDVAAGTVKVAAGAAADAMGVPRDIGAIVGAYRGVPQIGRGLVKGAKAAREAWKEGAAPAVEAAAEAAPAIAPELDSIARDLFKTPYAELSPNRQEFVQRAVEQTYGKKVQQSAATSPAAAAPPPIDYGAHAPEPPPEYLDQAASQRAENARRAAAPEPAAPAGEPTEYIDQASMMRAADARRDAQPPTAAQPAPAPAAAADPAAKPLTMLQRIDADIAAKKAARQAQEPPPAAAPPPPEEPPEAAAPAATAPQQPAPAAPAAARLPMPAPPATPEYVTPGQYERRVAAHAADNGISEDEAAQELQGHIQEVDRASTNRFLHAIGSELGYDHGTLSEIAHATYGAGLGKITHEQMLELGQKLSGEQATREPLAKKGAPLEAAAAPEPEGAPLGGVVAELAPAEIHADPVRFQFKAGTGKGGVTDKFAATSQWNKDNSGILSVWRDPADGKVYVVNGHHRLEMANRLGAPTVTVRYLDAANAAEARMKGALINIAEDQGTAIDAAKVFRDSGMTPEDLQKQGIKLDGRISKPGLAMANLDPHIFDQVVAGDITPERGAMIGNVAEHADQRQLVELIDARERAGKAMSDSQITEMLRMQAPKVTETQTSLFGDNEVERSLIAEKAAVSDYIQSRLAQKRRLFNAVGSERAATRLAEAGNVIDAEGNARVALATSQEHLIYQKLSTSTGAVDEALNEAAKALHAGENPAIVKVKTYAKIEPVIRAEADKLTGRGKASAERSSGSAPAGSGEAGAGQHDREAAAAAPAKTTVGEMMGESPVQQLDAARKRRGAKTRKTVADLMPN